MSQHDYILDNASGIAFRSDLNSLLAAHQSLNSGATAPSTTYASMWWLDTTTNILKQRNSGNTDWIIIGHVSSDFLNLQATQSDIVFGRSSAGDGVAEEIACTSFGRSVLGIQSQASMSSLFGMTNSMRTFYKSYSLTIVSGASETTLFSTTIAGGTLGTACPYLRIFHIGYSSIASVRIKLRLKYGGTTIAILSLYSFGWSGDRNVIFDAILAYKSASGQVTKSVAYGNTRYASPPPADDRCSRSFQTNNSSIDSSSNQTLELTVQMQGAGDAYYGHVALVTGFSN